MSVTPSSLRLSSPLSLVLHLQKLQSGLESRGTVACHGGPSSLHGTRVSMVDMSLPLLLSAGVAHRAEAAYRAQAGARHHGAGSRNQG